MNKRDILNAWMQMLLTLVEANRLAPKMGFSRTKSGEFFDAVLSHLNCWRMGQGDLQHLSHALLNLVEMIAAVEREEAERAVIRPIRPR